jgi:hypothetical protein
MNTPEMPRHRSTSMINRLCCDDSTILQLDIEMRSRRETTKQTESFGQTASAKRRDSSPWDKEQQQRGEPTMKRRCVGLDLVSLDGFSVSYKPLLPKTKNRMATSPSVFQQHWHSCVVSDSNVEETTLSSPQIGARPQGTFSTRNNPTNILSLLDAVAGVLSLP